jgi:hypothetical protein
MSAAILKNAIISLCFISAGTEPLACDETVIKEVDLKATEEMIPCNRHKALGSPTLTWRSEVGEIDKKCKKKKTIPAGIFCTKFDFFSQTLYLKFGKIVANNSEGIYRCISENSYGDRMVICHEVRLMGTTPSSVSDRSGSTRTNSKITSKENFVFNSTSTPVSISYQSTTGTDTVTSSASATENSSSDPYHAYTVTSANPSNITDVYDTENNSIVATVTSRESTTENSISVIVATALSIIIVMLIAALGLLTIFRRRSSRNSRISRKFLPNPLTKSAKYNWEFRRDHLQLVKELANGFFGSVYEAKAIGIYRPGQPSTVAVKMAKDHVGKHADGQASLYDEAKLLMDMGNFKHENVISLLGVCSLNGIGQCVCQWH